MKFSQEAYICIMGIMQGHLDRANQEKNKRKAKKIEEAMSEVDSFGTY